MVSSKHAILPFLLTLFIVSTHAWLWRHHQYDGDRIYRFFISNAEEKNQIYWLLKNSSLGLERMGQHSKDGIIDIRIPSTTLPTAKLTILPHFHTTILIRNLQDHIDTERAYMKAHSFRIDAEIKAGNLSVLRDFGNAFNDYQSVDTLNAFLGGLEGVERVSVGKAFWGEEIVGFKFGRGGKHVVFSGGMHAREWIGPAMVAWLTHFLVTKPEATHLLDLFTFHVIPVVNVEGYRYTRSKDRLWRKTLQPNPGSKCIGTDPNRNWDFAWSGEGGSHNPCTNTYQGSHPFSAPESLSLSTYMLNLQRTTSNNVISYIDFHSYSQLWMYPNSYTCDTSKMIKERDRVHRAAEEAVMALKRVGGTTFQYGDGCNTIYVASGTSIDWAYYVARIPYTYVVELRDRNQWGFALPASEIVPSGLELQAGILAMYNRVATDVYGETKVKRNTGGAAVKAGSYKRRRGQEF